MEPYCFKLPMHLDSRGVFVGCECVEDIPFTIQRVMWIAHVPSDQIRGGHAHRHGHHVFVAPVGSVRLHVNGHHYILNQPNLAVYVPPGNYVELDYFQSNTVVLVLCSDPYDPSDYEFNT